MKKIILKIKGIKCKVIRNLQKEIYCNHGHRCNGCCGLEICECGSKLRIKKNEQ